MKTILKVLIFIRYVVLGLFAEHLSSNSLLHLLFPCCFSLVGFRCLLSSETALKFKFLKKPVQLVLACNLEKVTFSLVYVSVQYSVYLFSLLLCADEFVTCALFLIFN